MAVFSLLVPGAVLAQTTPPPVVLAQPARPIFVLNSKDANVSVIDPLTWKETKRIATGKEPHHLYLTPDEKSLIIANAASDSLTFITPKRRKSSGLFAAFWIPTICAFRPT